MAKPRRSIRDIPLNITKHQDFVATPQKRDVQIEPDITEVAFRQEQPVDHSDQIVHIEAKDKSKTSKKIKIINDSKSNSKAQTKKTKYDIEPAFTTHESVSPRSPFIKNKRLWWMGLVVIVLLFVGISQFFAHATVSIAQSTHAEPLDNVTLTQPVTYKSFVKNTEQTISIPNPKTVSVQKKATGEVVLYNNLTTSSYDLVKTTRLETVNGSVYRLLSDVTIPGKKTVNGKDVPGSVTVKVEADKPGDIYNARPGLELRLPGLIKGTGTYLNIYGKTANQFTGGDTGQTIDTSSSDIKNVVEQTKKDLTDSAIYEFAQANPEFTIIEDSVKVTSSFGKITIKNDTAEAQLRLTVQAIGLAKSELVTAVNKYLGDKRISLQQGSLVGLSFAVAETKDDTLVQGKFNITVSGTAQTAPKITSGELADAIAGEASDIAFDYVQSLIPDAEITINIWPFWNHKLPKNTDDIDVIFE